MTRNRKSLHQRTTRILWAVSAGYTHEALIGQDGKHITIIPDTINDVFTFSDDGKVYSYRQAHDRIIVILWG